MKPILAFVAACLIFASPARAEFTLGGTIDVFDDSLQVDDSRVDFTRAGVFEMKFHTDHPSGDDNEFLVDYFGGSLNSIYDRTRYSMDFFDSYWNPVKARLYFNNQFVAFEAASGVADQNGSRCSTRKVKPIFLESSNLSPRDENGEDYGELAKDFAIRFHASDQEIAEKTGYNSIRALRNAWLQINSAAALVEQIDGLSFSTFLDSNDIVMSKVILRAKNLVELKDSNAPLYDLDCSIKISPNYSYPLDSGILLHEYGHAIFHSLFPDGYRYVNSECKKRHNPNVAIDKQCAFLEGWANFFSLAISRVFNFGADGRFFYSMYPVDYSVRYKDEGDNLDFGRAFFKNPNDEGYVTMVLWRLYRYSNVPLQAFLMSVAEMHDHNVGNADLTLDTYFPILKCAFRQYTRQLPESARLASRSWRPLNVLSPFPELQPIWSRSGDCAKN